MVSKKSLKPRPFPVYVALASFVSDDTRCEDDSVNQSWETLAIIEVGPPFGHKEAYEQGKVIGRIAAWVMIAVVVLWVLYKVFKS
jgi:hypothetical protein